MRKNQKSVKITMDNLEQFILIFNCQHINSWKIELDGEENDTLKLLRKELYNSYSLGYQNISFCYYDSWMLAPQLSNANDIIKEINNIVRMSCNLSCHGKIDTIKRNI